MASRNVVVDVDINTFQELVVEQSKSVPVLVDFWAPWCGPCRTLGPMLEQLARERNGEFVLAKVNVDENQELASEFGVRGIPAVFAIKNAEVVDNFVGVQPRSEVEKMLARLSPSEADTKLEAAAKAEQSDLVLAEELYRQLVDHDPHNEAARVGLARVLLTQHGHEDEAADLLHGIEVGPQFDEAERLRKILQLREVAHHGGALRLAEEQAASGTAESLLELGKVLAARGEYPQALQTLLEAAEKDRKLATGPIRETMVAIFQVVGQRSPIAEEYRDKLRALLY